MSENEINTTHLSSLFKIDSICSLEITKYCFLELGSKKLIAITSDKELIFLFIDQHLQVTKKEYDWDFLDNPVHSMCFETSGTWLTIVSDEKILLIPFLPIFLPDSEFDCKWSLSSVTVLPLINVSQSTSVVWWLTEESNNILIIGVPKGVIIFYSIDSQSIIEYSMIPEEITILEIAFDIILDSVNLVIHSNTFQQWLLTLEKRYAKFNWLHEIKDTGRNESSFLSHVKKITKDTLKLITQRDDIVDSDLIPSSFCYYQKHCLLSVQSVNGEHTVTYYDTSRSFLMVDKVRKGLRPYELKLNTEEGEAVQALYSKRLIYLLKKNALEIHITNFPKGKTEKRKYKNSFLWSCGLIGEIYRGFLLSVKENMPPSKWVVPTFLSDLRMPRNYLNPCLIITSRAVYLFNTVMCPSEWLVSSLLRSVTATLPIAKILGENVKLLLPAVTDMLLSRGQESKAEKNFILSKADDSEWIARLGAFNRINSLQSYNITSLSSSAILVVCLATLHNIALSGNKTSQVLLKSHLPLTDDQFLELITAAMALGLWDAATNLSICRGHHKLIFSALKHVGSPCRGCLHFMLHNKILAQFLLTRDAEWFLDYVSNKCEEFDTYILKILCVWMNPLQKCFQPVMSDLKNGIENKYTTRLKSLIISFMNAACALEARLSSSDLISAEALHITTDNTKQYVPRRVISCGIYHWAIVDKGNARILGADTSVETEMVGSVISVACGRYHTIVLTENGVYTAGYNSCGQLGVGMAWQRNVGETTTADGPLFFVETDWLASVASVAAGAFHSAAIDEEGNLYMWGWGVHGQLGLGGIEDHHSPQRVKFTEKKVVSVALGVLHSVALTEDGEVWVWGSNLLGQTSAGAKSSTPRRVPLPRPVLQLAAGYFHNLALSDDGMVWSWGISVNQLKVWYSASLQEENGEITFDDLSGLHSLDLTNVQGRVKQISAGWHHSCILDDSGNLYSWGLNFDGQLGNNSKKHVRIPTEVKIYKEKNAPELGETEDTVEDSQKISLAVCGGSYTICIDHDGMIYSTGSVSKTTVLKNIDDSRIIITKRGRRVIKLGTLFKTGITNFTFADSIQNMLPPATDNVQKTIKMTNINPINVIDDFNKPSWMDEIIYLLKSWITLDDLKINSNVASKFAYYNSMYEECFKLQLDNLKCSSEQEKYFCLHKNSNDSINKQSISDLLEKRISEISISILNADDHYPPLDLGLYRSLPCCCDESNYYSNFEKSDSTRDVNKKAVDVIEKCLDIFPESEQLWEKCFSMAKDYYFENDLSLVEFESLLFKYVESKPVNVTSAILFSDGCAKYNEILSAKLQLKMSDRIMNTWG